MENTMNIQEKTEIIPIKNFEYVLLDKLDYDYKIEDFILDTNNFIILEEKEQSKKDKKISKNPKEKSNKNKKPMKKKKKEEEDLNLSKASSNLSIFPIKSKTGNSKQSLDQKIKGKQKNMNVNVLLQKVKNQIEVIKTQKIPKEKEIVQAPVEEIIDTTVKQIESEDEKESVKNIPTGNKKNNKKKNKDKPKQTTKEEIKSVKEEKSNQQNKRVEDFLKSVKDKKTTKTVKEEKKISIKSEFVSSHKYMFTVDPTQRLKLRSLYKLEKETILFFFNLVKQELNFENLSSNTELLRNNMKETTFLIDNLCEMSLINEGYEEINLIIGKSLNLAISSVILYEEACKSNQWKSEIVKSSIENLVMNLLYIVYKYQLEGCSLTIENIEQIQQISEVLSNLFKIFFNKSGSGRIDLSNDGEMSFYFFSYSLCSIIVSQNYLKDKDSHQAHPEHLNQLDSNIKKIFSACNVRNSNTENTIDFDNFIDDYNNLRYFTKFSYLFERVRPNLLGLAIKVSKSIEQNLITIQNILIKHNDSLFARLINQIVLNFIHNFEIINEANENLYEEIFALIKYLCDDKVFPVEGISETFIKQNEQFDKRLELHHYSFLSDDTTGKYIGFLIKYIKYFERLLGNPNNIQEKLTEYKLFLFYFHQVLFSILNLRQGYVREKYYKIIEKLIEPYLQSDDLSEMIFEFITDFIKNNLLKEFDAQGNMIKNIKIAKDLTKFYSCYIQIKKNILKIFDRNTENKIEYSLFTLFYLNFLNLNKKEDKELINVLINQSENFIENILLLDRRLCSFIMKNYINQEIHSLDGIVDLIFSRMSEENISFQKLFDYLLKYLINLFSDGMSVDRISNLKLVTDLIEKLINLNLLNNEKLEIILNNLINTGLIINNSESLNLLKSMIIYLLNKIILVNWNKQKITQDEEKKIFYERFTSICDNIEKKFITNFKWSEFSLIKEITLINDNMKKIKPIDYIKTHDDYFIFMIETLKLGQFLHYNPDYFKSDQIEIEKIEQINENEMRTIKDSDNEHIDFDVILHGYINYFNHISKLFSKSNSAYKHMDNLLFNVNTIQETINIVLSCDKIFLNLLKNKNLLESFVRKYVSQKEISYEISEDSIKILKHLELSADSLALMQHQQEVSQNLTICELNSQMAVTCGEFIKNRCRNQFVFLFKEQEMYKMFLTKDKEFLQLVFNQLDMEYKVTILNEENLKVLLSKAQNEEEDLLEEVVYSIFSEKIIKYLEYPEDIIEFLTSMNEALKYDMKVDSKKYYSSILSYFYTWKSIMSKIENGFKLYTTEKNLVTTIDSYKTLLKFVVNYLEKNNKIYEMFLLLTVSLIHLIDEGKSLEDKSTNYKLDSFDDSLLTDILDQNSFQFLLSVLYKFVKIFPSLVKFYYEETKTKLKNTFKSLNTNIILPKMLSDLRDRIHANKELLGKYQMRIRDTKSFNYLEFDFNANDEIKFVIEIRIPPIFPLKKLDINFKCNALIDEKKLLNVKMNLNQTLNSSIDNITDNLINWSENVKQLVVVGNEPCPICYGYLHPTDKSLPGLSCKTCKKKFHSLCIKEWFKNLSNNMQAPSCPMCRSKWKQ